MDYHTPYLGILSTEEFNAIFDALRLYVDTRAPYAHGDMPLDVAAAVRLLESLSQTYLQKASENS